MSTPTIGAILDRNRGRAPGAGPLRLALAAGVLLVHAPMVASGNLSPFGRFAALGGYAVFAMLFGLSGFLATDSARRLTPGDFLVRRALRLLPALAVAVGFCALVLGPLLAGLPLLDYVCDPRTYRYLANAAGVPVYRLPGLFADNPTDLVNATLWTMPHGLLCCVILALCGPLGLLRRPALIVAVALLFSAIGFVAFLVPEGALPPLAQRLVETMLLGRSARLYVGFLLGIAAFLYRDRLPYDAWLFALCLIVALTGGAIDLFSIQRLPVMPLADLLVLPALIYVTVYLAVSDLRLPAFLGRGEPAYGIYLYGWPVQQTVVALLPGVWDPALQLLLAAPVVAGLAVLSWHCVEKPVLGLRRTVPGVARDEAPAALAPGAVSNGR